MLELSLEDDILRLIDNIENELGIRKRETERKSLLFSLNRI